MTNPLEATFRGEGVERMPGCDLRGHFRQWQAISDAMQWAAQLEMVEAVERQAALKATIAGRRVVGMKLLHRYADIERDVALAYGKWLGAKGFLRLAEGSTYDLTDTEKAMLARINWDTESFEFPGKEAFPPLEEQRLP